jgi:hypothetical protein
MKKKDIFQILAYTDEPMELYKIQKETHLVEAIDTIERYVRSSREYKGWIQSKKYKHNQTVCKALDIDVSEYKSIPIEQDHYPITLWDIVWIVGLYMIDQLEDDEYLTTFDIASQVIREHLDDQHIATVSLTITHHQMRHQDLQKVKKEDIHGDYESFMNKYKEYIPEPVQKRIDYNLTEVIE